MDREKEIRRKIRDLLRKRDKTKSTDSEDDSTESESESEYEDSEESEDEEIDRQKEMELTAKLLVEKVERLKRERMELEQKWNGHQSNHRNNRTRSTTAMMEKEMNILRKKTMESDSEYESTDGSDLDSIMSFSDNDRYSDHNSDTEEAGVKTFAKLRKEQSLVSTPCHIMLRLTKSKYIFWLYTLHIFQSFKSNEIPKFISQPIKNYERF